MKLAVVGCGALGSFYGAKLCRVHPETHFLVRTGYESVQQDGVWIESSLNSFRAHPHAARDPREIGPCDLVLIGLKTTANSSFSSLLPPLLNDRTLVVTLQNGLGNEEQLADLLGPDNILGGLCFLCANRIRPGHIRHLAFGDVSLGEFQRPPQRRTYQLAELFQQADVPCQVVDDLEKAHWQKLAWNIPFNGLSAASCAGIESAQSGRFDRDSILVPCLSTDQLLDSPAWLSLVRSLMAEVIAIAQALGHSIPGSFADELIERTRRMGDYKPSTTIDFEAGKPLELKSLFEIPLRRAQRQKVPAPCLAALHALLSGLTRT